jgi:hypothetical protein
MSVGVPCSCVEKTPPHREVNGHGDYTECGPQTLCPASKALDRADAHKAREIAKVHFRVAPRPDAEDHRKQGLARLNAARGAGPTNVLRLNITNVLSGNDYSAQLSIGTKGSALRERSQTSFSMREAARSRSSLRFIAAPGTAIRRPVRIPPSAVDE